MVRAKAHSKPHAAVYLAGYNAAGERVYEKRLSREQYWDGRHSAIDSDGFRKQRGIVRLTCTLCDEAGAVEEQCENHYDGEGRLAGTCLSSNG